MIYLNFLISIFTTRVSHGKPLSNDVLLVLKASAPLTKWKPKIYNQTEKDITQAITTG